MFNNKRVLLTIKVLGGESSKKIAISSDETVQVLFDKMCEKLNISEKKYFGICEQIYDDLNAPLDRFLSFEKSIEAEGITELSELKFQIKHIKRPKGFTDSIAEELFFKQIQYNIVNEVYPCPEKIAVLLASLTVQILFGDHDTNKHRIGYLNKVGLNVFLPRTVSRHDYAYWQERIFNLHITHHGLSKKKAMRKYIDIASTIPYFGMSFFEVKDESGTELLLGVAEDGVFFFNSQNLKLVHTLPYDVLSSWHLSDDGVDICFYENDEVHTISILTPPLKRTMIVALIDEYYALLPEKMKNDRVKPNNPKPFLLNDSSLYLDPVQRTFLGRFGSRLEYLKGYYMECCALGKEVPVRKFCQAIDKCIDNDEIYKDVDLSFSSITDNNITFFTKSLLKALEYKPERNFPWKENMELESINLGGNSVKVGLGCILDLLRQLKRLKNLDLSDNILGDDGAVELAQTLTIAADIRSIGLFNCMIGNKGLQTLYESLKWKKNLTILNLGKNEFNGQNMAEFGKFLSGNLSIAELDLSYNTNIDQKGIEVLLKSLENNKRVQKLNLAGMPLGTKGGLKVAALLEVNHNIKELVLYDAKLTPEVFLKIGRACRTNLSLEILDLSRNNLGKGADKNTVRETLLFLAQPNSGLRELILRENQLDFAYGEIVAESLRSNKTLVKLDISYNNITKNGAIHENWGETIRKFQTKILDFTNCGLKSSAFLDIISAATSNQYVEELHLAENDPKEGLKGLEAFLSKTQIKILDLRNLKINDAIFEKMGLALKTNTSLETLDLSENEITKEGITEFLQNLESKTSVKNLILEYNLIEESEKPTIAKQILESTPIENITM
ncbi:hypothetical protein FDP41_006927 [Naegleria fowleri]|uniref:FERM domain-containing protein n=1 Tax=Naegleria fowleri TaxID=5763 RepID=A0A6A5BAU8_NAEFO|nr:uncharacterized protein FDP41_006927 [Naegleria fowleri]KAF0974317.1 hypothetical protein FDP41_006927 [Naegleria fowleri]CAG4717098.1 unnamed protein product [Naegleria fowleri]